MKIIAVATDNFEFYYDVVKELKQRDIPFVSISPTDPIPKNIAAILTTEKEADGIEFRKVIPVSDDIRKGIRQALSAISGKESFQQMIVGIDPGEKPGIALLGDGKIMETVYADTPEEVREVIDNYVDAYEFQEMIIRIGHGDKTNRNRTINSLAGLCARIEIVNEEDTTHGGFLPDLTSAKEISITAGQPIRGDYEVEATEGEKREIQRRSRLKSEGKITISRELAKKVVEGEIDLKEAIKRQEEGNED
ncbi:MAG: hypothetical protein ACOC89_01470 [Candidatus Saliniplasma sp.]